MKISTILAPSLSFGVSQQPPPNRPIGAAELTDNTALSPVTGCSRRPGMRHLAVGPNDFGGPVLLHTHKYDEGQFYSFVVGQQVVRAFSHQTGQEMPVVPKGGTGPTDFSYLKALNAEAYPITNSELLSSLNARNPGDPGYDATLDGAATSKSLSTLAGQMPWGRGTMGKLQANCSTGPWFAHTTVGGSGTLCSGWNHVSLSVEFGANLTNTGLAIYDTTSGAYVARVKWLWSGPILMPRPSIVVNDGKCQAQVVDEGGGIYRIVMRYRPPASRVGHSIRIGPYIETTAATVVLLAYGIRFDRFGKSPRDYLLRPNRNIVARSSGSTAILASRSKTTALGTRKTGQLKAIHITGTPSDGDYVQFLKTDGTTVRVTLKTSPGAGTPPTNYEVSIGGSAAFAAGNIATVLDGTIFFPLAVAQMQSLSSSDATVFILGPSQIDSFTVSGANLSVIDYYQAYIDIRPPSNYLATYFVSFIQGGNGVAAATVTPKDTTASQAAPRDFCVGNTAYDSTPGAPTQAKCEGATPDPTKGVWIPGGGTRTCCDNVSVEAVAQALAFKNEGTSNIWQQGIKYRWTYTGTHFVQVFGATIRLVSTSAFDTIRVVSSEGESAMIVCNNNQVENLDDLPINAYHGSRVKVRGNNNSTADDQWYEFACQAGYGFGTGRWFLSNGYNTLLGVDPSTMPVSLTLKQDDGSGTTTGAYTGGGAFALYWEYNYPAWFDRLVGDSDSNRSPAFIGSALRSIFFENGRLWYLSGPNAVASASFDFFNIWRTTQPTLLDSDRINEGNSRAGSVISLNDGVSVETKTLLVSEASIFSVEGNITPSDTAIKRKLSSRALRDTLFAASDRSAFTAHKNGGYSGVSEIFTSFEGNTNFAPVTTLGVPRYIEGQVIQMAASGEAKRLVCVCDEALPFDPLPSDSFEIDFSAAPSGGNTVLKFAADNYASFTITIGPYLGIPPAETAFGKYIDSSGLTAAQVASALVTKLLTIFPRTGCARLYLLSVVQLRLIGRLTGVSIVSDADGVASVRRMPHASRLYTFKWSDNGSGTERTQNAWHRWLVEMRDSLRGAAWADTDLTLLIQRPNGLFIETMPLSNAESDIAAFYTHLDRRVASDDPGISAAYSAGTTTWTLPYTFDSALEPFVIVRQDTGAQVAVTAYGTNTVAAAGDYTGVEVWIGIAFRTTHRPSPAYVHERLPAGTSGVTADALTVSDVILTYERTGYLEVGLSTKGRPWESRFYIGGSKPAEVNVPGLSLPALDSDTTPVTVNAENEEMQFELSSAMDSVYSHLPFAITKMEITGSLVPAGTRIP